MSQAHLLRLMDLYPDVPAGEWASFFGWQWSGPSPIEYEKVFAPTSSREAPDEKELATSQLPTVPKPSNPAFWYLSELVSRAPLPPMIPISSLATDKSKEPPPVVVKYFDPTGYWRAELDRLLASDIESDEPDIDRCVNLLSQCQPVADLPCKVSRSYSSRTLLVVDQSPAMTPLYGWQLQQLKLISALTGTQAMQTTSLHTPPVTNQNRQALLTHARAFQRVVILTTLDQRWCDEQNRSAWHRLASQLNDQGLEVIILQPRLSAADEQVVDWIMASATGLVYPSCDSLASLSKVFGGGLSDVMAAWNHSSLTQPGHYFKIKPEFRHCYRRIYQRDSTQIQERSAEVIAGHRALKPDSQSAFESLLAAAQRRENPPDWNLLKAFVDNVAQVDESTLRAYFNGLASEYAEVKNAFGNDAQLSQLFSRVDQVLPKPISDENEHTGSYSLVGQSDRLKLLATPHPHAVHTTSSIIMDETGRELSVGDFPGLQSRHLSTQEHNFTLENLKRPAWAERIHRTSDGTLEAVHSDGARFELLPASAERQHSQWRLTTGQWLWASDAGIDEQGLWAVLSVGSENYRLRWIPAGSFMMGSPETEVGRLEDELMHHVTLSRGYWLGETTVTQSFWTAVARSSSIIQKVWNAISESSSNDSSAIQSLPKTEISWDDCNKFMDNLNAHHKSFSARLPSEAEWEYSCRAGTQSAYWWGEEMDSQYGNNEDNVKNEMTYASNNFGLKSMHGNVWEWCQDYYASYQGGPVTDPVGPETGQLRVLRGGGWFFNPRSLRSAQRNHIGPGSRFDLYGFRLAGGLTQPAGSRRGASVAADRDEGTGEHRGGQARSASEQEKRSGN